MFISQKVYNIKITRYGKIQGKNDPSSEGEKKNKINSLPTEDRDVGNYYSHVRHFQGKRDRMGRQRNVSYFGKEENAL